MWQQWSILILLTVVEIKKCYDLMYSTISYHVKNESLFTKSSIFLFPIIDNIYLKILTYLRRVLFYDPLIYFSLANFLLRMV